MLWRGGTPACSSAINGCCRTARPGRVATRLGDDRTSPVVSRHCNLHCCGTKCPLPAPAARDNVLHHRTLNQPRGGFERLPPTWYWRCKPLYHNYLRFVTVTWATQLKLFACFGTKIDLGDFPKEVSALFNRWREHMTNSHAQCGMRWVGCAGPKEQEHSHLDDGQNEVSRREQQSAGAIVATRSWRAPRTLLRLRTLQR